MTKGQIGVRSLHVTKGIFDGGTSFSWTAGQPSQLQFRGTAPPPDWLGFNPTILDCANTGALLWLAGYNKNSSVLSSLYLQDAGGTANQLPIPGGYDSIAGAHLSRNGTVAAALNVPGASFGVPAVWMNGTVKMLLPTATDTEEKYVSAVNNSGVVVGYTKVQMRGYYWIPNQVVKFLDSAHSVLEDINNGGTAVGYLEQVAIVYKNGKVQALAPMVKGLGSRSLRAAVCINEEGDILALDLRRGAWICYLLKPIQS